jgi:DNA-binding SARP family transcriptional activator
MKSPGGQVRNHAEWRAFVDLFEARQYEQLEELLREVQRINERKGDGIQAQILDAARQICLACGQSQAEIAWHQQASEEAEGREHELRQQLQRILCSLSEGDQFQDLERVERAPNIPIDTKEPGDISKSKPKEQPGIWQRIQTLLSFDRFLKSPEKSLDQVYTVDYPTLDEQASPVAAISELLTSINPLVRGERSAEPGTPSLAIYCLGTSRIYHNSKLITEWESLKSRSIFKYMVVHRENPISRDVLMDVFWSDADPDAARRNLHQAIYSLRQTLRQEEANFQHILFADGCYLLNPSMEVWIDSEEFEKHIQQGQRLEENGKLAAAIAAYGVAESLYQGDFLEDELYEDWTSALREHMWRSYLQTVDRLSSYYYRQGEYCAAIVLCQKILAHDNCCEPIHRQLMLCYMAQGQRHLAVRQYQSCLQTLHEELNLWPSDETVALYQRIISA